MNALHDGESASRAINFSGSQVITHGARAGMPRPHADVLLDQNTQTRHVLAMLKRNGFVPARVLLLVGTTPNIEVMPNAATQRLIADGSATDYGVGHHHREWQAWFEDVRVTWTQRGDA